MIIMFRLWPQSFQVVHLSCPITPVIFIICILRWFFAVRCYQFVTLLVIPTERFNPLHISLPSVNHVVFINVPFLVNTVCVRHISDWDKFALKSFNSPVQLVYDDLSCCRLNQIKTNSHAVGSRSIHCWNSIFFYIDELLVDLIPVMGERNSTRRIACCTYTIDVMELYVNHYTSRLWL